jgi:hypothetical protein
MNCKCFTAGYLFYCHMLPQAMCYFFTLVFLSFSLIWLLPPVAILIQTLPFVRGEELEIFKIFENKIERADPSELGHFEPLEIFSKFIFFFNTEQRGWVRCFLISCILCLFGWFPSVIFGHFMIFYHIYKFF